MFNGVRWPLSQAAAVLDGAAKTENGNARQRGRGGFSTSYVALPYDLDMPTQFLQLDEISAVSLDVSRKLLAPEFGVAGRDFCPMATRMPMPKATVDEDHRPPFGEYEVGSSGQVLAMKAKPETQTMRGLPDRHLGGRVLTSDRSHICRALRLRNPIHRDKHSQARIELQLSANAHPDAESPQMASEAGEGCRAEAERAKAGCKINFLGLYRIFRWTGCFCWSQA